jgi:hypothetical protein
MSNVLIGDAVIRKKSISVLIEMSNGKNIKGEVFMGASQRLQDLINGERMFLPVKAQTEKEPVFLLLNKSYIVSFEEMD